MEKLNITQIYNWAVDVYGGRMRYPQIDQTKQDLEFVLYDAIVVSCGVEERYGIFEAGIRLAELHVILYVFKESIAIDDDRDSIIKSFHTIDKYCRHRLPDKYLKAYDEAYLCK
ncbi:MAG: hypothetical protein LBQ21_06400 [Clostridiales Family XIII bacterium]|nr:hypothetical protein [Clostridiales Family XIII bacterium]